MSKCRYGDDQIFEKTHLFVVGQNNSHAVCTDALRCVKFLYFIYLQIIYNIFYLLSWMINKSIFTSLCHVSLVSFRFKICKLFL